MEAESPFQYKYVNQLTVRNRIGRFLWGLAYVLLFRLTPRYGFNGWRVILLRLFGARIGKGCKINPLAKIWAPWNLTLGDLVAFAEGVDCYNVSPITIGTKVTVSQRAFLCTASHDIKTLKRELKHSPIVIEDHVWVCAEAFVGPGVSIGEGSVIGARTLLLRNVEPYSVMSGNPAKLIKKREISNS